MNAICSEVDCADCERLRQLKLVRRIRHHVTQFPGANWKFVTMSSPNEFRLQKAFDVDQLAWSKLAKAAYVARDQGDVNPWNDVITYVGFREVTWSRKMGYNLHRHLLVQTNDWFWDWKEMHRRWDNANDGIKCNFDQAEMKYGTDAMINYASKYCVKKGKNFYWGGLSQKKVKAVAETLYRKHRFVSMKGCPKPVKSDWSYCCAASRGDCNRTDIMGTIRSTAAP